MENDGKQLYRIGVNPDCPVHAVFVGGQCFPRYSERVTGEGGETRRDRVDGAIVRLNDADVKAIKLAVESKVIRQTKGGRTAKVYSTVGSRYRPFTPRPDDLPVAQYLYMVPVNGEGNPHHEARSYPVLDAGNAAGGRGRSRAELK